MKLVEVGAAPAAQTGPIGMAVDVAQDDHDA